MKTLIVVLVLAGSVCAGESVREYRESGQFAATASASVAGGSTGGVGVGVGAGSAGGVGRTSVSVGVVR